MEDFFGIPLNAGDWVLFDGLNVGQIYMVGDDGVYTDDVLNFRITNTHETVRITEQIKANEATVAEENDVLDVLSAPLRAGDLFLDDTLPVYKIERVNVDDCDNPVVFLRDGNGPLAEVCADTGIRFTEQYRWNVKNYPEKFF